MPSSVVAPRLSVTVATLTVAVITGLLLAVYLQSPAHASSNGARAMYSVTFVPSWNGATHPLEYPYSHGKQGFLTPMIGVTHGRDYRIFTVGERPSPGLERLSEMGKHDPLDAEIRQAIASGKAGYLIELEEGSEGPIHQPVSYSFEINKDFPMVSLVGMIAPSPDWFYGVSDVELRADGQWLSTLSVTVSAWDSGGDAGTTYMAEDQDLNPKEKTRPLASPQFLRDGKPIPVGTMLFKRVPTDDELRDVASSLANN